MISQLHTLDVVIIAIYLGAMAAMGLYFSRKNTNTEEYFVGGRSFSGWIIGLSLVGTSISSITFLAFPGDAYKTAWLRFLPNVMLIVAVVIAARVFLPFFRRGKITSAYEYLEARFGPSIRIYGAAAFIIGQLVRVSIVLYLLSLVLQSVTGLDATMCILIGGVIVAVYTIVGGIDAVIWTDVIQTMVLVVGGVICVVLIGYELPGGLGQVFSVANEQGKFAFAELQENGTLRPVSWRLSIGEKTGTMMLLVGLSHFLQEYCGNQNVVQRYCASKSTREARRAMYVCAFSSVPIWAFYMFVGTCLFVFFQQFPSPEATAMLSGEGGAKPEGILPYFVIHHVPPGVAGIVIAAALAAAMSSLDSSINAIATVGVVDIYRRHFVTDRDDRHYLKAAWLFATLAAVFMIGGAIVLTEMETRTLQHAAQVVASLLAGGLLGIYLLGFLTNRGDARAVWVGIGCTILFTAWTIVVNRWPQILPKALRVPFDLYYAGVIGNLVMFIVGFTLAALLSSTSRDLTNLTVWQQDKDLCDDPEGG